MNDWIRIVGFAFVTLFLGVLLKELGFKGTRLVVLLGTVSLIGASVIVMGEVIDEIYMLGGYGDDYLAAIFKIIGVGYIFGLCSDICSDLGESALSGALTTLGRMEILALCVPYIKLIVEKGIELI